MKRLNLLLVVFAVVLVFGITLYVSTVEPINEAGAQEAVSEIPFLEEWVNSGHNDVEAEAFVHWDEDDPAEIPESCARCH